MPVAALQDAMMKAEEEDADGDFHLTIFDPLIERFRSILKDKVAGVLGLRTVLILVIWYIFSFAAIFLSKYILDYLNVNLVLFSGIQLVVATAMGMINTRYPCFMYSPNTTTKKEPSLRPKNFYRVMFFVGSMRFLVVFLGLISLKYIAISFMETIKSSAPIFTVVISRLMLKEKNGMFVQLSLIPIMLGLVLCSAYELSFTWIGFYAALGTNVAECLQFVASKLSLSHEHYKLTPAEFQVYTSAAAVLAQLLLAPFVVDYAEVMNVSGTMLVLMILNGLLYHYQTMMAWVLMEFLSPVTHSVCNTVKCALAVWISVPLFGNHITVLSGAGTCVVIAGVLLYNKARNFEHDRLTASTTVANGNVAVGKTSSAVEIDGHANSVDVNLNLLDES